ncbi:MAG: TRAM domain-containing protein [Nanoarchaeota archaeon]
MADKPQEGDVFETIIEAVGEKGDGICKKDGFVIFVPGVKKDEAVTVRVTKIFQKIGFGEVVSSKEAEERAEAIEDGSATEDAVSATDEDDESDGDDSDDASREDEAESAADEDPSTKTS